MVHNYPSCLDKLAAELNSPKASTSSKSLSPLGISHKKISLKPDEGMSYILRQGGLHHTSIAPIDDKGQHILCSYQTEQCSTCHVDWTCEAKQLPLITSTTTLEVKGAFNFMFLYIHYYCLIHVQ